MSRSVFIAAFVLGVCVASFSPIAAQMPTIRPAAPMGKGVVVLKAARLIDGTGKAAITNAVIVVTDDKITAVGTASQIQIPAGATVIDVGNVTLLPGFIDAHTHVIGRILGDSDGNDAV
ncbi:MAG: hypothetical protein ABI999_14765, partial [Acidobacteriota bacterium]